ncbi:MAG: DUF4381 family protein [Luteimonas sp.]
MQADALVLRDIHQPPAPSWWPPAPGWWIVVACVLLAVVVALWFTWRRRRRRRALARMFDDAVDHAATPAARIAAMSELLRRAARRLDPAADKLLGDDWLRFLDKGLKVPAFAAGAGSVLRDGAFRRDVSALEVDALRQLTRARFLDWMAAR